MELANVLLSLYTQDEALGLQRPRRSQNQIPFLHCNWLGVIL